MLIYQNEKKKKLTKNYKTSINEIEKKLNNHICEGHTVNTYVNPIDPLPFVFFVLFVMSLKENKNPSKHMIVLLIMFRLPLLFRYNSFFKQLGSRSKFPRDIIFSEFFMREISKVQLPKIKVRISTVVICVVLNKVHITH